MKNTQIEIRRSKRQTMSIEINSNAEVIVRVPMQMPQAEITRFITEKEEWITRCIQKAQERKTQIQQIDKFKEEEIQHMVQLAKEIIPMKVDYYARLMNVDYGRITIRRQKSRWGSCSAIGNLNFNCLLMQTPERIVDYVIVHELCHRKEMNHSRNFWNEVESIMPDYRERRKWLKEHGNMIIGQMEREK